MSIDINDDKLTKLIEEIEKVRRRKIINFDTDLNIQYLDPFNNLGKVKIPNNHLILGRRGSGKTTLLISAIKEDSNNFMVPIDCQVYRKYNSNKIILELLKSILSNLNNFIIKSEDYQEALTLYNQDHKGLINWCKNKITSNNGLYDYEEYTYLLALINNLEYYINELMILPDENIIIKVNNKNGLKKKVITKRSDELKILGKMKADAKCSAQFLKLESNIELLVSSTYQATDENIEESSAQESMEYEKVINRKDKIQEIIFIFSEIVSKFTHLSKKRAVLYLDDFYLIKLEYQPFIIQFFHDIYKTSKYNSFCFKICSIPNRTRLNADEEVDFSIKDDFSPIRLDKELDDFHNLKDFLLRITANLDPSLDISSIDIANLFNNDDVLNYAIVAAGGVPRDFLVNLAELIKLARTDSFDTIKKENLYSAVSDLKQDKAQNIEIECDISPIKLRKALEIIQEEIIGGLKTNVILYPLNLTKEHEMLLKNLVNLRYFHIINEHTTSKKVKDEQYTSYLIDMTFYATGRRLKQGFEFRSLWEKDTKSRPEQIRNAPIWNFDHTFAVSNT